MNKECLIIEICYAKNMSVLMLCSHALTAEICFLYEHYARYLDVS